MTTRTQDNGARIAEGANLRLLAVNLIRRAVTELRARDPLKAVDAVLFLASDDFPIWADVAGLPFADPFELLTNGNATHRTSTKGKTNECKKYS